MAGKQGMTYRDAGVDIEAGNALVERIKPLVAATRRPEVMAGIGGFGGMFALPPGRFKEPVLVSGSDGVGTKLKLASMLDRHDTIGIDLVAMCVNDIVVHGAEPLFFLDYLATGKLHPDVAATVIGGIADGCKQAGCALIGGETAEMPDMYADGEYDLAGFVVGAVEREKVLEGSDIRPGDVLVGLASSGVHSNGYSLVRRIVAKAGADLQSDFDGRTLGEALLAPTRIYVKAALKLLAQVEVHGFAHITGGGLTENIIRVVPAGLGVQIDRAGWELPAVFRWLADAGNVAESEMLRTFNCGVGFVVVCPPEAAETVGDLTRALGIESTVIGEVARCEGEERVRYR